MKIFQPGATPALRTPAALIFLAAVTLLAYANTFEAPFVFDDMINITKNPRLRMTGLTPEALARIFESPGFRPLADFSFAVNHFLHGYDVRGYHAVNLVIHIITGLLIFLVSRQTLRLCDCGDALTPFFAAALWLVNPVHTQSVTYIVQRMNSLAAMFYLLALFCYIQARIMAGAGKNRLPQFRLYALCLAAGILGLASKETVATLPVILLLYEWFFFQDLSRARLKTKIFWIFPAVLTIIALSFFYLGENPVNSLQTMYSKREFTIGQRLLTEANVIVYYLSLLLFPHPARLNLIYDFPLSRAPTDPVFTALAITSLSALLIAAAYSAGKHRLLSFAVLWFLITLVIESSIIPLQLVFEHRTYLPSVFPVIGLTWLASSHVRPKAAALVFLCFAVGACGLWTYKRNSIWTDNVLLWKDVVNKTPEKAMPYNNFGFSLLVNGETDQAIAPLCRGLELDPSYPNIRNTMAIALHLTGNSKKALRHCRAAIELNPGSVEPRITLGFILREQGRLEQAAACFTRVLAEDPDSFAAIINMGLIEQEKNAPGALSWFQKAVNINPASNKALFYLGSCLALNDRSDEAVHFLKKSLRLEENNYKVHCMLAAVLLKQRKIDAAIDHYGRALDIAPACSVASLSLAGALFEKGDARQAIDCLNDAVKNSPEDAALLWHVVLLLAENGRFDEAVEHMESLTALVPDNPKLLYNLACLYARRNDKDKAVEKLKQAVSKGYRDWPLLRTDKDLENIYDTPYYQNFILKK